MKQSIRRVHPLCWLVLLWLTGAWILTGYHLISYGRYSAQQATETFLFMLIGSVLVIIHVGIYEMAFRLKLSRTIQWLLLFGQAAFVLVLTQVAQDSLVAFTFSLVLFIALIELLKQFRPVLLASGGFLALLFLYMNTLGAHLTWWYLWRGDGTIFEMPQLLIAAGLLLYLQQQRAHKRTQALLHDLHAAHEQLSAYALRVEELTMLTERQRLARELHDTLTQGVAGILMQLEAASSYFGKNQPDRAHGVVLSALTRGRTVLTETRYVLQDLRADRPRPDDLPEMVQEEIERFTNSTGIPCVATLDALALTPDVHSGQVLRAISEGLANVAHHAQAQQVWICAHARAERLDIEVRDDGIGFDPAAVATRPGHYGLAGLRERTRLMGGQLAILSWPGQGTSIRIYVPIRDEGRCA